MNHSGKPKVKSRKNRIQGSADGLVGYQFSIILLGPVIYYIISLSMGNPHLSWDAAWYRGVAEHGYFIDGDIRDQQNLAFFPGFPLILVATSKILGIHLELAQRIAALVCYAIGMYYLLMLLNDLLEERVSSLAAIIISSNPFSIYLLNGYSETLFFATSILVLYNLSRKNYLCSSIFISYSLITRPHGIVLLILSWVMIFVENFGEEGGLPMGERLLSGIAKSIEVTAVAIVLPAALTLYWYLRFGDSLVYMHAVKAWGAVGGFSLEVLLKFLMENFLKLSTVPVRVEKIHLNVIAPQAWAATLIVLNALAVLLMINRLPIIITAYNMLLLLFWLTFSDTGNAGRHALMMNGFAVSVAMLYFAYGRFKASPFNVTIEWIKDNLVAAMISIGISFMGIMALHYAVYVVLQNFRLLS